MIGVLDVDAGNLGSMLRALRQVADNETVAVLDNADQLARSRCLIFPGQAAILNSLESLSKQRLKEPLYAAIRHHQIPFLGVCIGMQALFTNCEENGGVEGLGLFPGAVKRLPATAAITVPHMGWNRVEQSGSHPLWEGIADRSWFYFAHSYYVAAEMVPDTLCGSSHHGVEFAAAIAQQALFCCQFHPEKSGLDGLRLLANFLRWRPV